MIISIRWLKQYLNFPIEIPDIIDTLTFGGIEIEQAWDLGMLNGKIVVGQLKSTSPHPDADKLTVCQVDVGQGDPLQIVCGAKNMHPRDKVAVALDGAVLPNGMAIKNAQLRGVESKGMLCSGPELNYGHDASGILILPEEWKVGEGVDYMLDAKITPNRPDCLSIFGVARDLAALKGHKVAPLQPRVPETMERIEQEVNIMVLNKEACPRYTARLIRNVKVASSPAWLRMAVEAVGIRSINNVVDVTNYVMMELGHPLHAFDLDKLPNQKIIVRMAEEGERFTTLDDVERTLSNEDILICTPQGPVALGGVMGGKNSEISNATTNVLLESAYFTPTFIRKTSKRLELQTESSYRFERGTDREKITLALNRATQLIREICGSEVARGYLDVSATTFDDRSIITLKIDHVNSLLGLKLKSREIADILMLLGCEIRRADQTQLMVQAPSFRVDIEGEHDLIEEIARIYGYNKIPVSLPLLECSPYLETVDVRTADHIRDLLCDCGFYEAINYSFISENDVEKTGGTKRPLIKILNPLSVEQAVMRPSLLPGMLKNIQRNHHHGQYDFSIFEIGKVFWQGPDGDQDPQEEWRLIAALSGKATTYWKRPEREFDFYAIKGIAEHLLEDLGLPTHNIRPAQAGHLHPGQSAEIYDNGETLCTFGQLHPAMAEEWDLRRVVFILQAKIELLAKLTDRRVIFEEFGRFPSIERDFALLLDHATPAGEASRIMREAAGELLENLETFDVYEGKGVPQGKKSVAMRLVLRSPQRTLTDEEANAIQATIIERLEKEIGAALRQA
ncbi:phenylalanine--tRNA ligase subunit beta [Candidatus Sumerlaeota bacterium]|nr:phenylalanine--tRNA ligase subunit beta [Candidatus Sumerlaeota bacterium]